MTDIFIDIEKKIQKKNKILFNRESLSLHELLTLIRQKKHLTIVIWAMEMAEEIRDEIISFNRADECAMETVEFGWLWAKGIVKMPEARKRILKCHRIGREQKVPYIGNLYHALGQAVSSIHVETHAVGLAFYELTSIVQKNGFINYEDAVKKRITQYIERLNSIDVDYSRIDDTWAPFLMRDESENKEMSRHLNQNKKM